MTILEFIVAIRWVLFFSIIIIIFILRVSKAGTNAADAAVKQVTKRIIESAEFWEGFKQEVIKELKKDSLCDTCTAACENNSMGVAFSTRPVVECDDYIPETEGGKIGD